MADPLGLFPDQASSQGDPLGLFSSQPEDTRDWISKAIDTHLAGHPIAQQVADAANPIRMATALPGGLAASARGAVELPLSGIVGLGNIGQDGEDLVHKITTVGGLLSKSKGEEAAGQVIGEGFGKIAEAGGKTAAALDPIGIDDETLKYLEKGYEKGEVSKETMLRAYKANAATRSLGEMGSQLAVPIPGAKGIHGAIEAHMEGKLRADLEGEHAVFAENVKESFAKKEAERQKDVMYGQEDPLGLFPESGAPKSPYEISNAKVDENGMPIDELRSQEIAKMDAGAAPQGDLLHETGPGAIQLREGPFPSAKDRPDTIEQISNESSAESGSRSPEEGVHNPYMSVMDKDTSPIETIPYDKEQGPGQKLLAFNDLPEGAKDAVNHAEFMKSDVDHVDLKNATFEKVEVPIKDIESKTQLVPDNSKSQTTGPILLDRQGRIVDGLHRVMDAKADGKETIEVYQPVADKSGRPMAAEGGRSIDERFNQAKNLGEAIDHVKTTGTPFEAALVDKIAPYVKDASFKVVEPGVKVEGGVPTALHGARGVQMTNLEKGHNGVWVKGKGFGEHESGLNNETVLHEALHQATSQKIAIGNMKASAGTKLAKHVSDLYDLSNHVIREYNKAFKEGRIPEQLKKLAGAAFSDPRELVSWGLTNSHVQEFLKGTKGVLNRTAWGDFVDRIRNLLGLDKSHTSALADLIDVTDKIISHEVPHEVTTSLNIPRHPALQMGLPNKGNGLIKSAADAIMNKIRGEAKSPLEAAHEITKLNGLDRRPAKEMISAIDPSKAQDIGLSKKVVSNLMDVDGILANTAHTHGSGQILKWVRDSMKLIDRSSTALKEDLLKGTVYEKNKRGFSFRSEAKDSPVALFKTGIKDNVKDMNSMLKEWFSSAKDGRDPKFQTAQQKAIYDKWQGVFGKLHDEMNTLRKSAGLQPIDKQQSYFPLMRMGDYRILVTDGNNNMIGSFHVPDVYYGKLLKNRLEKELPTVKVGDPTHLNKSKYDYSHNDFTAMEAASKALKDQPDVQAALHKAYADIMQHRGFGGKHGVESQHLLGAMGLEDGHLGATKALEAFEAYTSRSVQYMANLEKKAKMAELMKDTPPELKQKLGNTFDLANDLYNNSKGSLEDKLKGVTDLINLAGRASGLGETGFRNKLRSVTGLASTWLITTPSFIFSQIAQPLTGFAGLMKSEGGGYSSIPFAGKDVLAGYAKTLLPSALDKEAISWAAKNGYMTPEVADLMGFRGGDHTQAFTERVKAQLSKGGSVLEREAVRIPYFLMQLEAMKGKFQNKEAMFEAAGEKTDRYMVDYNRSNQAMVWGKMGALGENSRQLKSFSNNMLGQFAEYLQDAKHGDTSTLAVYLGTSVLLAGLTGNLLLQTADDIIRGLNALGTSFGQSWNVPTSQEVVMKSMIHGEGKPTNLDNILTFGLGSTILGHDISSSQAQNSAKSMLSIPVASLGVKTATEVAPYLIKKYKGEDKPEDYMKFLIAITPPMAKEMIKSRFIENGLVPDPNHDMQKIYQRTPEKKYGGMTVTEMIGRAPLDEVRASRIISAAREDVKETIHDKQSAANALADRILSGQKLDSTLVERWIKEGGDPRELNSVVKKRAMEKQFDFVDRTFQEKGNSGFAKQQSIQQEKKAKSGLENQSLIEGKFYKDMDKPVYDDSKGMSQMFRTAPGAQDQNQMAPPVRTPVDPFKYGPSDRVLRPPIHLDQIRKQT